MTGEILDYILFSFAKETPDRDYIALVRAIRGSDTKHFVVFVNNYKEIPDIIKKITGKEYHYYKILKVWLNKRKDGEDRL